MSSAGSIVDRATERLRAAGSTSPRLDASLLVGNVLSCSRANLLAHPEWVVSESDEVRIEALVARRAALEPMAYVLGEREFFGRVFRVDRRALIPRPETELLVELGVAAIDRFRDAGVAPRVVELGTGAGAVAISVALERSCSVVATDISHAALTLAQENAHELDARVALVQADLLRGLAAPWHVVLANLPYVPSSRDLPLDVIGYEPAVAIFGGAKGTEIIERLLREAKGLIAPGGELCMELDEEEQAVPVAELARSMYGSAQILQDAGGYDRVVQVVVGG